MHNVIALYNVYIKYRVLYVCAKLFKSYTFTFENATAPTKRINTVDGIPRVYTYFPCTDTI